MKLSSRSGSSRCVVRVWLLLALGLAGCRSTPPPGPDRVLETRVIFQGDCKSFDSETGTAEISITKETEKYLVNPEDKTDRILTDEGLKRTPCRETRFHVLFFDAGEPSRRVDLVEIETDGGGKATIELSAKVRGLGSVSHACRFKVQTVEDPHGVGISDKQSLIPAETILRLYILLGGDVE